MIPPVLVSGDPDELMRWAQTIRRMAVPGGDGWLNFVATQRADATVSASAVHGASSSWSKVASADLHFAEGGAGLLFFSGNLDDPQTGLLYLDFRIVSPDGTVTLLAGSNPQQNVLRRGKAGADLPATWPGLHRFDVGVSRVEAVAYHSVTQSAATNVYAASLLAAGNCQKT